MFRLLSVRTHIRTKPFRLLLEPNILYNALIAVKHEHRRPAVSAAGDSPRNLNSLQRAIAHRWPHTGELQITNRRYNIVYAVFFRLFVMLSNHI